MTLIIIFKVIYTNGDAQNLQPMFLSLRFKRYENKSPLKVNRSRDMKQKIYETLISPKIKTNGIILNNCIDWVCLCFDRLLLLDLSEVQVLRT